MRSACNARLPGLRSRKCRFVSKRLKLQRRSHGMPCLRMSRVSSSFFHEVELLGSSRDVPDALSLPCRSGIELQRRAILLGGFRCVCLALRTAGRASRGRPRAKANRCDPVCWPDRLSGICSACGKIRIGKRQSHAAIKSQPRIVRRHRCRGLDRRLHIGRLILLLEESGDFQIRLDLVGLRGQNLRGIPFRPGQAFSGRP